MIRSSTPQRDLSNRRSGVALAAVLAVLLVVSLVSAALVQHLVRDQRQATWLRWQDQSQWLAHSGMERARAQLRHDPAYRGETWRMEPGEFGEMPGQSRHGSVIIRIESEDGLRPVRIAVESRFPAESALSVITVLTASVSGDSS